ncbi:MAG TPA: PEP-CTERM sorting domain-containing protein, partial [Verrucomicrobiae bacterium]|nr:PEP-CTERM sorting domain-containing protein [Verrucomicrobiae bacterium]
SFTSAMGAFVAHNDQVAGLAPVNTTGGLLLFSDASTAITFQATVGNATPEPGSVLLLISGAALLGILCFRSRLL